MHLAISIPGNWFHKVSKQYVGQAVAHKQQTWVELNVVYWYMVLVRTFSVTIWDIQLFSQLADHQIRQSARAVSLVVILIFPQGFVWVLASERVRYYDPQSAEFLINFQKLDGRPGPPPIKCIGRSNNTAANSGLWTLGFKSGRCISDIYYSLNPLWSGMGEVVPARISPTLHPPSPPTVL